MKKWQIVMTDTAKSDLREIALGIYEVSKDPDTAVNFVMELEDQCNILNSQPDSGAVPKDYVLKALGYRFLVYKHYLVFYLTDSAEKTVYIHAVFNEKLDYFRYMRKRI
jgi:plasmid stabilization system protein ParE